MAAEYETTNNFREIVSRHDSESKLGRTHTEAQRRCAAASVKKPPLPEPVRCLRPPLVAVAADGPTSRAHASACAKRDGSAQKKDPVGVHPWYTAWPWTIDGTGPRVASLYATVCE